MLHGKPVAVILLMLGLLWPQSLLYADAGADNFRQAVNIKGPDAGFALNVVAHGFGPRLCAEDADFQRCGRVVKDVLRIERVAVSSPQDLGMVR